MIFSKNNNLREKFMQLQQLSNEDKQNKTNIALREIEKIAIISNEDVQNIVKEVKL